MQGPKAGLGGTERGSGWLECEEPSGHRCATRLESQGCIDHGEGLVYSKCDEKGFQQDGSVI